ncbi:MAG TPA: AgmX/PglI C-terminal domain-containing protein [Kofleriaceae bacterium]|nr:AgmX/PglI C-terminal domain-containing protein [Kofleriaceae bacterium]
MHRVIALALVAACGGRAGEADGPTQPAALRVVACAPTTPFPAIVAAQDGPPEEDPDDYSPPSRLRLARGTIGKRAQVSIGLPSSTAGIEGDKIAAVVRGKLGELTKCYAKDLEHASPEKASVVYRFSITPSGTVDAPQASSMVLSRALDLCVRHVLRSMVFPPSTTRAPVQVSYPLVFDSTAKLPPDAEVRIPPIEPWTPFSRDPSPSLPSAAGAARATEAVLRTRLDTFAKCFAGSRTTGSLRVMLELDVMGELDRVRVGGLGDAEAEGCIAKALAGLRVVAPKPESVEVACDLARGDAQPWRVTPSRYGVITVEKARVRYRTDTLVAGALDPAPLPTTTYLIDLQRDATGAMFHLALAWASQADAALVALDDGARPPLFLGIAHTSSTDDSNDDGTTARAAIRIGGKSMAACIRHTLQKAKLGDPAAIESLVQRMAAKCKPMHCSPTLLVALDADAVARDLVEVTGAARRAGFDRVLIGGTELGCGDVGPARPPAPEPASGGEDELE